MSLLYLFIFIFVPVYLVLTTKEKLFKPNLSLLIAVIVTSSSLIMYDNFLSGGSWERMNQKQSLETFLDGNLQTRSDLRGDIRELFTLLIEKPDIEAGELYILARKLKNANEYILAEDVYEEIYDRYGDELDGDIIAEYAQVLFISKGRKFNDSVYVLLKEALLKSPNNPSALTLQGLAELENKNPKFDVKMKESWFIRYNKGGTVMPHDHGNCSMSCVYYVQIGDDADLNNGSTYFLRPYGRGSSHNDFGGLRYINGGASLFKAEEGKLLVWPSFIMHGSKPYLGKKNRIIMSANIDVDIAK